MEKTSKWKTGNNGTGLLKKTSVSFIIFFLASPLLFAKMPSAAQIRSLTVKSSSRYFFTAQENEYALEIPGIEPSQIQTDLYSLPSGVSLVSSKREEYVSSEGERGTRIKMWFTFRDTGIAELPPLIMILGRKTYYIPFQKVEIYENPLLISPQASIEINSSSKTEKLKNGTRTVTVYAGEEIQFTLKLQFFVQLLQFDWKLPENSIFKEIKKYNVERGLENGSDFSAKSYPLAVFSWKPLVSGTYALPEMNIYATSYNGIRKKVILPPFVLKVLPSLQSDGVSKKIETNGLSNIYSNAFAEQNLETKTNENNEISMEDAQKLSEFYSKERNSIFPSKNRKLREEFESSLGLEIQSGTGSRPLGIFLIIFTAVLFLISVLFFILKKFFRGFVSLLFVAASLIFGVKEISSSVKKYGIFSGGEVLAVPEEDTSSRRFESSGKKIEILEEAGNYYLVKSSELNGWVLKNSVFKIK